MTTITRERAHEITLPDTSTAPRATPRPTSRTRAAWYVLLAASIGFVVAGSYTVYRGWEARGQVRDQLVAQRIVTPEDASIPNARVDDAATAMAQADIIEQHALEATGGKTYAEMDREDPRRQVAFSASALRTSLLSAVLAFNVATLAMGFGAFVAGTGLLIALVLILLPPTLRTR